MRIKYFIKKDLNYLDKSATVSDILNCMSKNSVRSVVLLDNNKPIEIFTAKDIFWLYENHYDPSIQAHTLSKENIIIVNDEMSVEETILIMTKNNLEELVVVDSSSSFLGMIHKHDITEIARNHRKLKQALAVFEHTNEGIMITDNQNKIISINKAFSKITKYSQDEIRGKTPSILKSNKQDKKFYERMWNKIIANGHWSGEIFNRKKTGEIYPEWLNISAIKTPTGEIDSYIGVFSDITRIKESETMIHYLSHNDPITNLPNRLLLSARLEHSISIAKEKYTNLSVVSINIDNLKSINDSFGHIIGDEVIIEVSKRLNSITKHNDTLARVAGDEFILVLEHIGNQKDIDTILKRIMKKIKSDMLVKSNIFNISVCMGVSIYPQNGLSSEDLVKNAETALHNAKKLGEGRFEFYNESMTSEVLEKIKVEQELKNAIENDEFEVYFQPQIDIKSSQVVGAEALIRWNHKEKGVLTPNHFLPYLEASDDMAYFVGEFVLRDSCSFFKSLEEDNILVDAKVAVNLSKNQILNSSIVKDLEKILLQEEFSPKKLELEVVETFIMHDVDESIALFKSLKSVGVELAIDDFGTGYSSLSYIKKFPIDKLKIDKSFIDGVANNKKDNAIVKTIIALAKGLGLRVLAEGVETKEQLEFLKNEGCDLVQGWIYSKALTKDDFIEFVKNYNK